MARIVSWNAVVSRSDNVHSARILKPSGTRVGRRSYLSYTSLGDAYFPALGEHARESEGIGQE